MTKSSNDGSPSEVKRPRRLTITYYIEPQNLRRIVIPVGRANVFMALAAIAILWTIGSVTFLATLAVRKAAVEDVTPLAAKDAADGTNPRPAAEGAAAAVVAAAVATKAPPQPVVAKAAATAVAAAAQPVVKTPEEIAELAAKLEAGTTKIQAAIDRVKKLQQAPAAPAAAAASPTEGSASPLSVERAQFLQREDKLDASFAIQNKGGHNARGHVWGVATFTADNGQQIKVASATGIDVDAPESPDNLSAALSYKAKRSSNKALSFPVPAAAKGKFTDVKILVSDEERQKLLVAPFDIP